MHFAIVIAGLIWLAGTITAFDNAHAIEAGAFDSHVNLL
jgi:hypothetical protein